MEKSEKKKHKILSKFIIASTIAGSAVGGVAYLVDLQNKAKQAQEEQEEQELLRREMTYNDFSTFSTNDTPDDDISDSFYNAYRNKGFYYLPTFSSFNDNNYATKKLIIEVLPSVSDANLVYLQEVVDYLNEVFAIGQMNTQMQIARVTTPSSNCDISFGFAPLQDDYSGQATLSYPGMVSEIGEILMNTKVWTTSTIAAKSDVLKSVILHEFLHCFDINHNDADELSTMYYVTNNNRYNYWKMNPNDLRSFFYEQYLCTYESNPQLFQTMYDFVESQAVEYTKAVQNHTNADGNHYMQPNTVAYFKFLAPKNDDVYDYFTVNLNDIFLGQYEAAIYKKNGDVQQHTGRAYTFFDGDYTSFTHTQVDDQVFLLDDFMMGQLNQLTTLGFSQDRRFKLDIGMSYTSLRNMVGFAYNEQEKRDNADLAQELEDYVKYIYPNITTQIYFSKKEKEEENDFVLEKTYR